VTRLAARATPARAPREIPPWTAKFFHDDTPAGAGYHGLKAGRDENYTSADMNFGACKPTRLHPNGVLINTHWRTTGHDHFTGPGVIANIPFSHLTWHTIKRLRAPGGWRIRSARQIIRRAARLGYTHLEMELKDGVDHLSRAQLVALIRQAEDDAKRAGISIHWKTLSSIGNPLKRMKAVHAAGGIGVLLPRDNPHLPAAEWWPVTDYVRGRVTWTHPKESA
jgi:hypothetical protein